MRRLALFGSVRRDTAHADRDVDLLVEFEPEQKTLAHLVDLGDLLESVLGRHVELVTAEGLSPSLRPHILAEADFLVEVRATLTRQALEEDPILQRAIVRSLEIIGEASKRLPAEMRDANPAVEWRALARM